MWPIYIGIISFIGILNQPISCWMMKERLRLLILAWQEKFDRGRPSLIMLALGGTVHPKFYWEAQTITHPSTSSLAVLSWRSCTSCDLFSLATTKQIRSTRLALFSEVQLKRSGQKVTSWLQKSVLTFQSSFLHRCNNLFRTRQNRRLIWCRRWWSSTRKSASQPLKRLSIPTSMALNWTKRQNYCK